MRKILSILFLFATITAMAGNVTIEEAQRKAQAFFMSRTNKQYQIRLAAKSTQIHRSAAQTVQESYYVFNVGEDNGYILVSGDDRTPAILGYADKGNFDANSIPANMKAWLQNYEDQLDVLSKSEKGAVAAASEHQAIRPLIASTWNQGEPYNNMCPMDGEQRSLTGCVATVMAQIINYYKYPSKTTKTIPSFTTSTKHFLVDSIKPTAIDWENILNNYSGNETEVQKKAIANLMFLCGTAVKMDYTNYFSGAVSKNAAEALKDYFDYDDATRHIQRTGNQTPSVLWRNVFWKWSCLHRRRLRQRWALPCELGMGRQEQRLFSAVDPRSPKYQCQWCKQQHRRLQFRSKCHHRHTA